MTVEDLVRYTGVCKSWYSLITSPHFISLHMSAAATTTTNNDLLLVRDCTEEYESDTLSEEKYSLHLRSDDDDTFTVYKSFDFPFKNQNWYFRVIGCCNGVMCLSNDLSSTLPDIILWNPSVRKFVVLPMPIGTVNSHGHFSHSIGFGFNASSNDFKVVRVAYVLRDDVSMDYALPMVEVYERSVGSWTSVDPKGFPSNTILGFQSQVFLNNAVHWVGRNRVKVEGKSFNTIVSFDLRTDVFGVIKFPLIRTISQQRYPARFYVSTCGESLALIQTIFSENYQDTCCVWVMKQYGVADSWTKLFSIDLTGGLSKVCGVLRNEEALVIVDQSSEHPYSCFSEEALVSYEPKSKHSNRIGEIRNKISVFVDYFVETLALLGVKGESVKQADSDNTLASKQSIP